LGVAMTLLILDVRLMGTRAKARFAFISDEAEFTSEDLLGA
jgi:hypothetical protein